MTRTTRNSIKAEDVAQPPPPPAPATSLPQESEEEPPIQVHKRIRSPLFEKVFEKALKSSLSGVTPESWNKCFPTPCARRPQNMKILRDKFCEIYELNVRKNFEDIVASRKLLASLDNLDILVSEAQSRKARFLEENPSEPLPMDPPPKPNPKPADSEPKSEPEKQTESEPPVEPKAPTTDTPAAATTTEGESSTTAVEMSVDTTEKQDDGPKPPPPLYEFTPQDLFISHLYPILQLQSTRLESLKTQQQSAIDKLIQRREEQQKEIKQLIATLEKRLAVVDEAAEGVKEILEMDGDEEMIEL
ncbi:hypothetical protein TWF694_000936 [Orbilia ellipsospora]|uniref:Uncharacterized protein n=1 Tax=Orbilia ellipsospora TaxID=2528407 RepID=A0AAV9XWR3_9PEZI